MAENVVAQNTLSAVRPPFFFSLVKNILFFQNAASFLLSRIPPTIQHNLEKYRALRKAFYLTALEQLPGDYLEFGVFTGSSFVAALRIERQMRVFGSQQARFFGFDSFSGFGKISAEDAHPFYLNSTFAVNEDKIRRNIKKKARGQKVELVKGYFEDTLSDKTAAQYGISAARVVLIDCDLMEASTLAFDFIKPILQTGTMILLDDLYSYRGDESRGTAGAFHKFCRENPHLGFRRVFDYGFGGGGYIVSRISAAQLS